MPNRRALKFWENYKFKVNSKRRGALGLGPCVARIRFGSSGAGTQHVGAKGEGQAEAAVAGARGAWGHGSFRRAPYLVDLPR